MEESKILGVMMILVRREVDVPNMRKPIVKWWGDYGETMSELKFQDVDYFDPMQIGIAQIIVYMMSDDHR